MDFNHYYGERTIKTLSDGSSITIRGTLDPVNTNVGEGVLHVLFRVQMWLTEVKFNVLLPCFGFTNVSTLWTLGDTLPDLKVIVGPAGAPEVVYNNCIMTDWSVSGQKGQFPILLDMGFVGKTRVEQAAGTFFVSQTSPAMIEGYTYPFPDGTYNETIFTLLGSTRLFPNFKLALDYGTITEFNNSVTATNNCPTGHVLRFGASSLYSTCDSTTDLLTVPMSGDTAGGPLAIDLQRTVAPTTWRTLFSVANAKLVPRVYNIKKNDFNRLPIQALGYALADGTPMLTVTNSPA